MPVSNRRLMEMTPGAAVVQMFADANNTPLEPTAIRSVGIDLETTEGRLSQAKIRLMENEVIVEDGPSDLTVDFSFNRVDVATRLVGIADNWRPTLPISTQDLLDQISVMTNQVFYPDDFVLETITSENARPYVLKAKVESMRWYGSLEITLSDDTTLAYIASQELVPLDGTYTLGALDAQRTLWVPEIYYGQIDITDSKSIVEDISVGSLVQNHPGLRVLINTYCGNPLFLPGFESGNWVQSLEPQPFNLFNAQVIEHETQTSRSTFRILIDPTYCTNFGLGFFDFYYRRTES